LLALLLLLVFPWLTWLAFLIAAMHHGLSSRRHLRHLAAGQAMLTGPGSYSESKENTVNFPEISTPILEKVQPSLPSSSTCCLLWVGLCGFHNRCVQRECRHPAQEPARPPLAHLACRILNFSPDVGLCVLVRALSSARCATSVCALPCGAWCGARSRSGLPRARASARYCFVLLLLRRPGSGVLPLQGALLAQQRDAGEPSLSPFLFPLDLFLSRGAMWAGCCVKKWGRQRGAAWRGRQRPAAARLPVMARLDRSWRVCRNLKLSLKSRWSCSWPPTSWTRELRWHVKGTRPSPCGAATMAAYICHLPRARCGLTASAPASRVR